MGIVPDSSSTSTPDSVPTAEPLEVAALETERHVASAGWDQNPRVFALVDTAALIAAEPGPDVSAASLRMAAECPVVILAAPVPAIPQPAGLPLLSR